MMVAEVTNGGATIRPQWGFPPHIAALAPEARRAAGWYEVVETGKDPDKHLRGYVTVETGRAVVDDVVVITYETQPRDLAVAKVSAEKAVNDAMGRLLAQSDWAITRRADTGTEVPADIVASRAAIRSIGAAAKAGIVSAEHVDAVLAAIPTDWGIP